MTILLIIIAGVVLLGLWAVGVYNMPQLEKIQEVLPSRRGEAHFR